MRVLKSGLLWQFIGGFALGTLGLIAFQSPEATHTLVGQVEHVLPRL